jgi:hypothetical protein
MNTELPRMPAVDKSIAINVSSQIASPAILMGPAVPSPSKSQVKPDGDSAQRVAAIVTGAAQIQQVAEAKPATSPVGSSVVQTASTVLREALLAPPSPRPPAIRAVKAEVFKSLLGDKRIAILWLSNGKTGLFTLNRPDQVMPRVLSQKGIDILAGIARAPDLVITELRRRLGSGYARVESWLAEEPAKVKSPGEVSSSGREISEQYFVGDRKDAAEMLEICGVTIYRSQNNDRTAAFVALADGRAAVVPDLSDEESLVRLREPRRSRILAAAGSYVAAAELLDRTLGVNAEPIGKGTAEHGREEGTNTDLQQTAAPRPEQRSVDDVRFLKRFFAVRMLVDGREDPDWVIATEPGFDGKKKLWVGKAGHQLTPLPCAPATGGWEANFRSARDAGFWIIEPYRNSGVLVKDRPKQPRSDDTRVTKSEDDRGM